MSYVSEIRSIIGHKMLLLAGANVILARDDDFMLLQQRKDGSWGLPGGLLEPGESLEETAYVLIKGLNMSECLFCRTLKACPHGSDPLRGSLKYIPPTASADLLWVSFYACSSE